MKLKFRLIVVLIVLWYAYIEQVYASSTTFTPPSHKSAPYCCFKLSLLTMLIQLLKVRKQQFRSSESGVLRKIETKVSHKCIWK